MPKGQKRPSEKNMVLLLLSALVKRFSVSCMRDFLIITRYRYDIKPETTFTKEFCPKIFFYVFCAKLQDGTPTSYWKPNTSVLLYASWILNFFFHFWAFLLLCSLVSHIFTNFFRGSALCLERCDSYGNFGYLKKK